MHCDVRPCNHESSVRTLILVEELTDIIIKQGTMGVGSLLHVIEYKISKDEQSMRVSSGKAALILFLFQFSRPFCPSHPGLIISLEPSN
jgi:hypothetical protein